MKITVGTPKKINTYFVFQNKTFDYEYKGEYLWAPQYSNNMSTPPHHWHRMKEIKK